METTHSIFLVDDEMDHGHNPADFLGESGYRLDIAPDGPTALELLAVGPYDAALLDLVMPEMDGLSLLRRIRELRPAMPACFVTAYPFGPLADDVRASQAGPMLIKPFDIPRLLDWIDGAVGRTRGDGDPQCVRASR
jgi:DNA-binding response OmpR family regulator